MIHEGMIHESIIAAPEATADPPRARPDQGMNSFPKKFEISVSS
jgi:hypothetical protein